MDAKTYEQNTRRAFWFQDGLSVVERPRLFVSFSGGRTSAYMTKRLLDERRWTHDVRVLFANTGQENEKTLEFVRDCDRHFGFGTIWLEAVTDPKKGNGVRAKRVKFRTAARDGEPFEAAIAKHGIPNRNFPHCTRETKTRPMRAWLREHGWKTGTYDTAIGIRDDEIDRIPEQEIRQKERLIYPLAAWNIKKADVLRFWSQQTFNLGLDEKSGNCRACWKKSLNKLVRIARETPEAFEWTARMEAKYPFVGTGKGGPYTFFREGRSTSDILALAAIPGEPETIDMFEPGGCGESCEVFST